MSDEETTQEDVTQAPAAVDPYFVKKDGTAVTGGAEDPDAPQEEAPPEEPKPAAKKAETKQSIGDAWREVKQARKEQRALQAELDARLAETNRVLEEAKQRDERIRKDFRGYVKESGLNLRDLLEADLKESDQDPKDREIQTLKGELGEVKQALQQLLKKDEQSAQQATAQSEIALIQSEAAKVAEDYPRVSRLVEKLAPNIHADFYALANSGQKVTLEKLFQDYEDYLESIGVPLTETAADTRGRNGSKQTVRPSRVKGASLAKHVAEETDDDGDGADDGTAPALTNRSAGARHTNGRFMSREERVAMAASKIQFRNVRN